MRLYRSGCGILLEHEDRFYRVDGAWDDLVNQTGLIEFLIGIIGRGEPTIDPAEVEILPPIGSQEVWAAGVTYFRSRVARQEESEETGGSDFYERVYEADRPELFVKASPHRVVGHLQSVRIRKDSSWSVPEPELTVLINSRADVVGYTVGNDMSARDIEGENPLYLPQAKIYDQSCALGPGVLVTDQDIPSETGINLEIFREGDTIFSGTSSVSNMKRSCRELIDYLFSECSFPGGCYLMTGTGIVPPAEFTLRSGDDIRISIDYVGTLVNRVI